MMSGELISDKISTHIILRYVQVHTVQYLV